MTTTRTTNGQRQFCRGALEQGADTHVCTTYTTLHYPDGGRFHFCDDHPLQQPAAQPASQPTMTSDPTSESIEVTYLADWYRVQADGTVLRFVASRGRLRNGQWRRVTSERIAQRVRGQWRRVVAA